MIKDQIIAYFTQIYYNIKYIFDVLSRKEYEEYPKYEIDEDFDEFIDFNVENDDNIALLRRN
jgi:hypothetical protein